MLLGAGSQLQLQLQLCKLPLHVLYAAVVLRDAPAEERAGGEGSLSHTA